MTTSRVLHGDARAVLETLHLEVEPSGVVVVTDPVWPNAPRGMFPGVEDPAELFAAAARHFPRLARRVIVHLGCASDPRFLAGVPAELPFVRVCWLRYAKPTYYGTVLGSGDVAYVYGSNEGPEGATVLPGECTSVDAKGRDTDEHPCPRKMEHVLWLIRTFTKRSDLVIDPFAGSGTTGLACARLGRSFLGIERSEEYVSIIRRRLDAEARDTTLRADNAGQIALMDAGQRKRQGRVTRLSSRRKAGAA